MYNLRYEAIPVSLQLCYMCDILKIEQKIFFTPEMLLSIILKSMI